MLRVEERDGILYFIEDEFGTEVAVVRVKYLNEVVEKLRELQEE